MTIICSIILFTTWRFSFLNAICISKVPGHFINRKFQASTARTAVQGHKRSLLCLQLRFYLLITYLLSTFTNISNYYKIKFNLTLVIFHSIGCFNYHEPGPS